MSEKRKVVTSEGSRDKKAHGADKRDHRASESQRRKFGLYNCSFYSPVASHLVPMILSLLLKSLALRSFSLC